MAGSRAHPRDTAPAARGRVQLGGGCLGPAQPQVSVEQLLEHSLSKLPFQCADENLKSKEFLEESPFWGCVPG